MSKAKVIIQAGDTKMKLVIDTAANIVKDDFKTTSKDHLKEPRWTLRLIHIDRALQDLKMPPRDVLCRVDPSLDLSTTRQLCKTLGKCYEAGEDEGQDHYFTRSSVEALAYYFHERSFPLATSCHSCGSVFPTSLPQPIKKKPKEKQKKRWAEHVKFRCSICHQMTCDKCYQENRLGCDLCRVCAKSYSCSHCHWPQDLENNCTVCGQLACPGTDTRSYQTCGPCYSNANSEFSESEERGEEWWQNTGYTTISPEGRCCRHPIQTNITVATCYHHHSLVDVCFRHRRTCATCPDILGCVECLTPREWIRFSRHYVCHVCEHQARSALNVVFGRDLSGLLLKTLFAPIPPDRPFTGPRLSK